MSRTRVAVLCTGSVGESVPRWLYALLTLSVVGAPDERSCFAVDGTAVKMTKGTSEHKFTPDRLCVGGGAAEALRRSLLAGLQAASRQ